MATTRTIIQNTWPNKRIFIRLANLINSLSNNMDKEYILLSIEKANHGREYCQLTLSELELIYVLVPKVNRCFYEIISEKDVIKLYIDFEYPIINNLTVDYNKAVTCCLKILYYHLKNSSDSPITTTPDISSILNEFLVLDASSSTKESYHLIHANPSVLFENTKTLGVYIKSIFYSTLFAVANHRCSSFSLSIDSKPNSLCDLISLLSPFVLNLRANCSNCYVLNGVTTAGDIAHMIVSNKNNQWMLSVDLHVYGKNQQFRLFDSMKIRQNNPLTITRDYPFDQTKSHCYFEILCKSLITNITDIDLPRIILENGEFFFIRTSSKPIHKLIDIDMNLNNGIQKHFNTNISRQSTISSSDPQGANIVNASSRQNSGSLNNSMFDNYIPFIIDIITQDKDHIGRIQSCIQGNRNTNKLFFNIVGNYRFCPKIGKHHERNCTAIIVDTSNNSYAIRCKDPECDNSLLSWHPINKH